MKICYLLVTCSREASRDSMLRKVVESFKTQSKFEDWKDHFYVFDNASTYGDTPTFLRENFDNVFVAEENYGYWSAVNWFCDFASKKGYEYVYILESDCVHYDIEKLDRALSLLENDQEVGMVRASEFLLEKVHLYDKSQRHRDSRTCDWFSQFNIFSNQHAQYATTDQSSILKTNLVAKVCGLHRVDPLKKVLNKLIEKEWFIEVDFQKHYFDLYKFNAIIDGGIYNSSPAYEPNVIAGSLVVEKVDKNGYRKTREGFVTPLGEMKVNS